MKKGIHPKYYPQATVVCSCGNTWTTGSTKPLLRIDLCPRCHPFFTGEQRIVDTAGQVERFMRRLERAQAVPRKKKVERRLRRLEARAQFVEQEAQLLVNEPARGESSEQA
jgi:large subunit ribosomal protein L31